MSDEPSKRREYLRNVGIIFYKCSAHVFDEGSIRWVETQGHGDDGSTGNEHELQ